MAVAALLAGVAAYERLVADDEDLISRRVAAYRRHPVGRVLVDTVIIATAVHLCEYAPSDVDPYHWLMRVIRPKK